MPQLAELGQIISNFANVVSGGMVVFFPSYSFLDLVKAFVLDSDRDVRSSMSPGRILTSMPSFKNIRDTYTMRRHQPTVENLVH